jgi:hypothetical protein
MPDENDEEPEHEELYKKLLAQLKISQISDKEALPLHMWLSDQASEQVQQKAISTAIEVKSLTEQIEVCALLEKRAFAIAEQFSFLNQFSGLDSALSKAFYSSQKNVATDSDFSLPAPEKWTDFRGRLAIDSALLASTARQTLERLKGIHTKKGRPAKAWRNSQFFELVNHLLQLKSCTREECIRLATELWNNYFPDNEINDPDSAGRIISREKNTRKIQGQNAA